MPPMSPMGRRRLALGLTQAELAEIISAHPTAVGRWEAGTARPHASMYPRLAKALKVDADEVVGWFVGDAGEAVDESSKVIAG